MTQMNVEITASQLLNLNFLNGVNKGYKYAKKNQKESHADKLTKSREKKREPVLVVKVSNISITR